MSRRRPPNWSLDFSTLAHDFAPLAGIVFNSRRLCSAVNGSSGLGFTIAALLRYQRVDAIDLAVKRRQLCRDLFALREERPDF